MGRLSQLYWFLNYTPEDLPSYHERKFIFTHLDVETEWVKDLRKERLKEVRELNKLNEIFNSILCLCVEGRELTSRDNLLDAIQKEANIGLALTSAKAKDSMPIDSREGAKIPPTIRAT